MIGFTKNIRKHENIFIVIILPCSPHEPASVPVEPAAHRPSQAKHWACRAPRLARSLASCQTGENSIAAISKFSESILRKTKRRKHSCAEQNVTSPHSCRIAVSANEVDCRCYLRCISAAQWRFRNFETPSTDYARIKDEDFIQWLIPVFINPTFSFRFARTLPATLYIFFLDAPTPYVFDLCD